MTVRELITALEGMPQDHTVITHLDGGCALVAPPVAMTGLYISDDCIHWPAVWDPPDRIRPYVFIGPIEK